MYNSLISASFDEQSDNLPGKFEISSALLRRVNSLALRAAKRALAAISPFSTIIFPVAGFSNKNLDNASLKTESVTVLTSLLPCFVFICLYKCVIRLRNRLHSILSLRVALPISIFQVHVCVMLILYLNELINAL